MKRKFIRGLLGILLACSVLSGAGGLTALAGGGKRRAAVRKRADPEEAADPETEIPEHKDLTGQVDISVREQKNAITDAVYENYIREHADPRYTDVEQMKLVNAVLVKQSMFDRGVTEPGDTIGSIMSGIEAGEEKEAEKFLAQISNVVALYELSESSEYYVARINTMDGEADARVADWMFAGNDNEGNVLSGCIYDDSTTRSRVRRLTA